MNRLDVESDKQMLTNTYMKYILRDSLKESHK